MKKRLWRENYIGVEEEKAIAEHQIAMMDAMKAEEPEPQTETDYEVTA